MLHRFYIGHKVNNVPTWEHKEICERVAGLLYRESIQAFTAWEAQGYWEGRAETTTVVEVVTNKPLTVMGENMAALFRQDAVLHTKIGGIDASLCSQRKVG